MCCYVFMTARLKCFLSHCKSTTLYPTHKLYVYFYLKSMRIYINKYNGQRLFYGNAYFRILLS